MSIKSNLHYVIVGTESRGCINAIVCRIYWWQKVLRLSKTPYPPAGCTEENGSRPMRCHVLQMLYGGVTANTTKTYWFAIGKGVRHSCLVYPVSFNWYSEVIMRESADDLTRIGVTFTGRTINNLRCADDLLLIAQSPKFLDEVVANSGLEIVTK